MATYGHQLPGPSVGQTKVVAKDILANGATGVVEITQPKNTIIEAVYVRILDDITVASAVDIAFQMGTTNSNSTIVAASAAAILDGSDATTVKANNVFKFSTVAGTAGPSTAGVTNGDGSFVTDDRTLHAQFTVGAANVTAQGGIEVSCIFRTF
jgi:hypothetical protein